MVKPLSLDPGRYDRRSPHYHEGHPPRRERSPSKPEPEPPRDPEPPTPGKATLIDEVRDTGESE